MKTYRIANWDQHFENNRTREMKSMSWVPLPVKLAGDGYTELVDCPNGAAVYGAWVACVLVAASCDTRGTLLRGTGEPHTPASLARITRLPEKSITEMLQRAQAVGWIEVAGGCGMGAGIPQEGAARVRSLESDPIRSDPRESEGIRGNRGADAEPSSSAAIHRVACVKGDTYELRQDQLDRWSELYPALDVPQQVREAIAWLEANPSNRKTLRGMPRFFSSWLGRSQNRARPKLVQQLNSLDDWVKGGAV